jgi:hypothetical protein
MVLMPWEAPPIGGEGSLKREAAARGTDCGAASRVSIVAGAISTYCGVMVSFTAATSWLSVKGFGRNANCWFSGRLFSKASSA